MHGCERSSGKCCANNVKRFASIVTRDSFAGHYSTPVIAIHVDSRHLITPRERICALADDGRLVEHDAFSPSPHLARHGIAAQDDDGIVCATVRVGGVQVEVAAQDPGFLRGSVGERHGGKIIAAIARARAARCPLLLFAASGGVRLHEANAGEIALARALRALVDARADGIVTLAIGVADVFGGMSVVAAACNRLALTPRARLGLSGPRVIESVRGRGEMDAADTAAVDALFGAAARIATGLADGIDDDAGAQRGWIARQRARSWSFATDILDAQARLQSADAAEPSPVAIAFERDRAVLLAFHGEVDARALASVDAQLIALPPDVRGLLIVEDSRGHDVSAAAERAGLSRHLAHHALVLGLLRARGVRIVGVVDGVGHSAAFFANALQADALFALPHSRIIAMEPQALARVIGIDAGALAQAIDTDPLLGHSVRHFAAIGALTLVDRLGDAH